MPLYDFTAFAECIGTDCKQSGKLKKNHTSTMMVVQYRVYYTVAMVGSPMFGGDDGAQDFLLPAYILSITLCHVHPPKTLAAESNHYRHSTQQIWRLEGHTSKYDRATYAVLLCFSFRGHSILTGIKV
jgi:hypothetical protein